MLVGPALQNSTASNAVTIPTAIFDTTGTIPPYNQIYSGAKWSSDGNVYKMQANGGWSNIGAWLLTGDAADFYLERTVTSGALLVDAGTALQLNTDRSYYIEDAISGDLPVTATVTFQITNSGGSVVYAGPTNYRFWAYLTDRDIEEP